ncbi:MAG: hypothetical protein IIX68_07715 [Clostridia bacterium]|nr:hypothetical protein [Clostridia bacterium]
MAELAGKLDALSPLKVLGRGYAIAYKEGQPLRSVTDAKRGDRLAVRVEDGQIECEVQGVISNE